MPEKQCLHTNVKIVAVSRFIIPKGWEWLQEQDDKDMAEYFVEETHDRTVCADCAEILEEN